MKRLIVSKFLPFQTQPTRPLDVQSVLANSLKVKSKVREIGIGLSLKSLGRDECNCSIAIIMTGPCKHCPLSTLAIMHPRLLPSLGTGHWLDNEAPRHSHNYRGANILIGNKLPRKLSKHVAELKVGQNTSIDTLGPRWPLSLQPRPTVMSVGWIYVSKWSPTWHFYFALQPSGWELLSNNLPRLSGALWDSEGRCLWLGWTPGGSLVSPWLLISSLRIRIEMISAEILLKVPWLCEMQCCLVAIPWHKTWN